MVYGLIVGLGNPGIRYARTRHNYGWIVLDEFAKQHKLNFSKQSSGTVECAEFKSNDRSFLLVKPQTFMNRSGEPLQELVAFYKIPVSKIVVLHDEVDLPFGTIRLKKGGGEAGHNGLKSISECLGSKEYIRVRLGVGRPVHPGFEVADWVLAKFTQEEEAEMPRLIDVSIEKINGALSEL